MTVVLQSASGRQVSVRVLGATTGNSAARVALKIARDEQGDLGWMVLHVL